MKLVNKAVFLKKLQILLSKYLLLTQGMAVKKQMRQASFKKWKVYAKSPFGSVAFVVEYLGRYTHKVAITKHRILSIPPMLVLLIFSTRPSLHQHKPMQVFSPASQSL